MFGRCEACKAKDEMIVFLKEEIKRRDDAWQNERAEYKRTVDVLLSKEHLPIVGQGVMGQIPAPALEFAGLNIFEDEIERKQKEVEVKGR